MVRVPSTHHPYEAIRDTEDELETTTHKVEIQVVGVEEEKIGQGSRSTPTQPRFSLLKAHWICRAQYCFAVGLAFVVLLGLQQSNWGSDMSKYWDSPGASARILFVGDSFTFYNGGIDAAVKKLAAGGSPSRVLVCDAATRGGSPLEVLWGLSYVQGAIMYGKPQTYMDQFDPPSPTLKYDWVVIQDDIPEYKGSLSSFFKYTRLFNERIRSVGSIPLLFMTWSYDRLSWITQDEIAAAHKSISKELDILVAPVGLAFKRSLASRPSLAMLGWDHEHETIHGTYLASNVIYSTLYDDVNVTSWFEGASSYVPSGVSAEEAKYLRQIAAETVAAWKESMAR